MALTAVVVTGNLENDSSPGYTDFTSSGFGTPDVALVFATWAAPEGNPAAGAGAYIGFWDGTTQVAHGYSDQDAQATSNSRRGRRTDRILTLPQPSTGLYADYTIANITDGVRITLGTDNTSYSRYCTVVLIKGVTNKKVGTITRNADTDPQDITAIGFKPDLVFFLDSQRTSTGEADGAQLCFGVAHNDSSDTVTQGCVWWTSADGEGDAKVNNSVNDDCVIRNYTDDGTTSDRKITISGFDSSGFTLTSDVATASNITHEYLAIELPNPDDAYVAIKDSKTSTGTQAYTGTGFTPILLGLFGNTDTATNSESSSPTGAMSYGWADGTTEQCLVNGAEDGVTTTNTFSRADTSNVLNLRFADDTVDAVAALDSFDSDGWTLNYSDGSASARKMLAFALGNSVSFQYARPDADVSDGDWLPSTGTDLYACIDETTYSDTDYIYTTSLSACTVALGNVNDPQSSDNHIVRYRAKGDGTTDLVVTLKQGSTTIATWTESNASSTMTSYSHTLTTGEADSITDYTDLRLTFEAA